MLQLGSLMADLRRIPAPAWILFGGTFVNRFGSFVLPFLVLYVSAAGFSAADSGMAVGAYGVGLLIATLVGGHLADRIGRRNTIALSMFSAAAAMVALSQARGLPALVALSFVTGLTSELYRPASSALIADLVPQGERVTAFAMYRLAINAGVAFGTATAGFLADRSFLLLFIGDALTCAAFGVVALLFLPTGTVAVSEESGWRPALQSIVRNRPFLLFLTGAVFITCVDFQVVSTVALHMRDVGLSNQTYGLLVALNGFIVLALEIWLTRVTQLFNPRNVIALGFLLQGIGFALTGLAGTVPMLALTVVVWTIGEMIFAPVSGALVADLSPEQYRGRYMGMWGMTWSVGMILGPLGGTRLYEINPALVWSLCAIFGVVSAALVMTMPTTAATRPEKQVV
jgi:MFS family permease